MPFTRLSKTALKLNLGFLALEGEWDLTDKQQEAAWELYVELATRITVADLKEEEGLLREALTSFYNLFGITREILRKHGPAIAIPPGGKGDITLGYLAVALLNKVIRPLLAKWHPLLRDHEESRSVGVSTVDHERAWIHSEQLRKEIALVRIQATEYAEVLAEYAGVASIHH